VKRILEWQIAIVKSIRQETPSVKTFTLALPNWFQHKAGQHYDVRLAGSDGCQTECSYSIASEPERTGEIDLTVEKIEDGKVSSYMHDILLVGDQIEVRGPIGGYFAWKTSMAVPLLLVAGGSGIVPLMSMIRHVTAMSLNIPLRLLYSSRTPDDVIYSDELSGLQDSRCKLEIFYTFTRQMPPGWSGYARRIDTHMLREVAGLLWAKAQAYVCGPTLMVEAVANGLLQVGLAPRQIRTERFGPTGSNG
jgi:ferredoxin-NADP reductase